MTDNFDISDLFDPNSLESVENKIDLERAMANFKRRDAVVVYLFASGFSQQNIAERVGLNQSQISRILSGMHKKVSNYKGIGEA